MRTLSTNIYVAIILKDFFFGKKGAEGVKMKFWLSSVTSLNNPKFTENTNFPPKLTVIQILANFFLN